MLKRSILTVELFRLCSSKFRNLLCRGGPHLWNESVPKIIINDTIMFFLKLQSAFSNAGGNFYHFHIHFREHFQEIGTAGVWAWDRISSRGKVLRMLVDGCWRR